MERPVFQPIGSPADQLDSPALVVDLAAMESNIELVHSMFRHGPTWLRPDVTRHKCPAIAHQQLAAGGTVGGIAVSRVGEAEVFAQAGFTDILVADPVVTRPKIARLCALARHADISVAIDNPRNVADLSQAADTHGVTLRGLVAVGVGPDGCGVEPGTPALDLARAVSDAPGISFSGLMGGTCTNDPELQHILDTRALVEKHGLEVEKVSLAAGVDHANGITEVRIGSYPLTDQDPSLHGVGLMAAARILATVVSHPVAGAAVIDAGHKAIGPDLGYPEVDGRSGARVARLSAEHGRLELEGDAETALDVGAKVWLVPRDTSLCVNQYDYIHAVRQGRLEAVWEVAARGRWD